jgi:phosphomannomutase
MTVPEHIFKAYDIRGIYPNDINESNFSDIVKAIYTFFVGDLKKDNLQIVLARDMRQSSPSLFEIAREALVNLGATVIDIGLATTPTLYFASLKYGYDAGILVTASHNPPEYNGVKFVKRNGNHLVKIAKNTGMEEIRKLALKKKFVNEKGAGKVIKRNDVLQDEVNYAFEIVNPQISGNFKIVVDPANAMGIFYLEKVFSRLPYKLIKMNFELDGTFPAHIANPLKFETLKTLQEKVVKERADLGIATDGDGDRIFFIDEQGKIIPATAISSIIAKEILENNPREKIIIDVRYTRNAKNVIEKNGGKMLESVVGHSLITEQVNREGAAFAGESSGHFYFRETGGTESSIFTLLYVLDIMCKQNKPISKIVAALTTNIESGEFNFVLNSAVSKDYVFKYFANAYKNAERIYYIDGITVEYPNWRFNIRASNTEPLLRLNLEGESKQIVDKKLKEVGDKIIKQGAKPK